MSFCSNCGAKIPDNGRFCPSCGKNASNNSIKDNSVRKVVYEGAVHKCPNCGETVPSFSTFCPACNCELRAVSSSDSIDLLTSKLKKAITDYDKLQVLKMFPIPNSREGILDFMIIAASSFNADSYIYYRNKSDLSEAWLTKMEQCQKKAELLQLNYYDITEINKIYEDVQQKIKDANKKRAIRILIITLIFFLSTMLMISNIDILQYVGAILFIISIVMCCIKPGRSSISDQSGYSSWSPGKKITWVFLNIFFCGIPAVIYYFSNKKK